MFRKRVIAALAPIILATVSSGETAGQHPVDPARNPDLDVHVGRIRILMRDAYYPNVHKFTDDSIAISAAKWTANASADNTPGYDFIRNPELLDSIQSDGRYPSLIRSVNRGRTWTPAPPPPDKASFPTGLLDDGTAVGLPRRTFPVEGKPNTYEGLGSFSKDNWKTVTQESIYVHCPRVYTGYADGGPQKLIHGPIFHSNFLTMSNGDLIAVLPTNFEEDTKFTTGRIKWRAIIVKSTDGGRNWHYVSTAASMASLKTTDDKILANIPQGFAEPAITRLPDGTLICAIRTGVSARPVGPSDSYSDLKYTHVKEGQYYTTSSEPTQPLYITKSTDSGRTWTKPKIIGNPRGSCPRLLLLSNGVLALSYGRVARPTQGNRIIFSTDGGDTWTNEIDIYPGLSSGYTGIVEAAPGKILYVFDACISDGPKVPDWIGAVDITVRLKGSPVAEPTEPLGQWRSGLRHPKQNGVNRLFLVTVHLEGADRLTSVAYGGQRMTRVIDSRAEHAYVGVYMLNEHGISRASDGGINVRWDGPAPTRAGYSSVFLGGVDQKMPIGATRHSAVEKQTSLSTGPLNAQKDDLIVLAATAGHNGDYAVENGFVRGVELTILSADGLVAYKSATGVEEDDVPSITHTRPKRQVLTGFVVRHKK